MSDESKRDGNHLPISFWQIPATASTTLTMKQLRETLLYHEGWLTACGCNWDICSKSLGAGVYRVWLEERA